MDAEKTSQQSVTPADGDGVHRAVSPTAALGAARLSKITSRKSTTAGEVTSLSANAIEDGESEFDGQSHYRTMSWPKAAGLLFGEYVCLAILAFPSVFGVLGMAGGVIACVVIGLVTLYTSLILHKYIMAHPNLLNICDIGYQLFGKKQWAYEATAIMLCLNNIFIQGLHTLTGAEIFNTLSNHGTCSIAFAVVTLILGFLLTIPRQMNSIAKLGVLSSASMFIAILLTIIFSGVQDHPAGYQPETPVRIHVWAPPGTTFVAGFNAFLNITFTFVGQICYPSFIAEMKNPADFPKALYAITVAEFILFILTGAIVYHFTGDYVSAPAVVVLKPVFKKIAFAFVLPTTIIIGVIYASVVAKYIFQRIFYGTEHYTSNSVFSWGCWMLICLGTWVVGWIIGEAIPFFGSLLSLMSALFDGFFGFIYWAFAYFELNRGNLWRGASIWRKLETAFNVLLIFCGLFILGPGVYTSVEAIIAGYKAGTVGGAFSCADNSV